MLSRIPALLFSLGLIVFAPSLGAQLTATSVSPASHAVDAPTATTIQVGFNQPINPSTLTSATFRVFGRSSGVMTGALSLQGGGAVAHFQPARPFFPGEPVNVMLSAQIATAGGSALVGGFAFTFWTAPAPGGGQLISAGTINMRRPGEGSITCYGAYSGDLDRDGAPDLSIPCETSDDVRVIRNDGCGTFSLPVLHTVPSGSVPSPSEGADFNSDGVIDLAVANTRGNTMSILFGNGTGGYLPAVTYPSGGSPRGLVVLDVEGDGDADVVTANRTSSNCSLHRNLGAGTFAPAVFFEGGGSGESGLAAADCNGDGYVDLMIGHYNSQQVSIALNNGAGVFAVSAVTNAFGQVWMLAAGDVDGDGAVDAVTANSTTNNVAVIRGNGIGGLQPAVVYTAGTWPIAVDLGDLDGDGDLDVVFSNFTSGDFTLYRNNAGVFGARSTLPAGQAGSCALWVDYDRDGDLDMIGIDELTDRLYMYRQTGPSLTGVQPASCGATLRIDEAASLGGYVAPPHPVTVGGTFFVGITGSASTPWALVAASGSVVPGIGTPFGLLNLDPASLVTLVVSSTNAAGEALLPVPVPVSVSVGVAVPFQAFVPLTLTNPETIITQ